MIVISVGQNMSPQCYRIDEPPGGLAERCQYVIGLANELYDLKGRSVASELLADAGEWTRDIDDLSERRRALVAFASALFNIDDYDGGQKVLRRDDDPTWRSDILLALASPGRTNHTEAPVATVPDTALMRTMTVPSRYGKSLNFRDVFEGQERSRTTEVEAETQATPAPR